MNIYNNYDNENSNMSTIAIRKIGSTVYIPCRVIEASISDKSLNQVTYNIVPEKCIDDYNEYTSNEILTEFEIGDMITPERILSAFTDDDLKNELLFRENKRNNPTNYK